MAKDQFTIKDDTPTSSTYQLITIRGSEASYRDSASSIEEQRTMRYSTQTGKDVHGNQSTRTLVGFGRTDEDADGMPATATAHIVINVPNNGTVTTANFALEWEKLKNFVDANITELSGGFPPSNDVS